MKYDYQESYKHKLAKELLYQWILNIENEVGFQPSLPFYWRVGNYGVHLELPFYETDDPYYFELSKGLYPYNGNGSLSGFDPNIDRGQLLFIPDITIFHKGTASILIEVVHTSPLSKDKLNKIFKFFNDYQFEVYQIEAENILSQTNKKCELKFRRVRFWDFVDENKPQVFKKNERLEEIRKGNFSR